MRQRGLCASESVSAAAPQPEIHLCWPALVILVPIGLAGVGRGADDERCKGKRRRIIKERR